MNKPSGASDIVRIHSPGIIVSHCRLPAWSADDYVSLSASSSIGLSFTRQDCVVELAGRTLDREVQASQVVVTGSEAPVWIRVEQPSELIEVSASADLREAVADELMTSESRDLGDLGFGNDPVAWALGARLRAACRGAPPEELEVEALVRALYGYVLRSRFGGRLREKGDGFLESRRLARVTDYIEANLGAKLSLTTLADIAALSPFHFQRSFRRAVGCSPHDYVALRRAERARSMILEGASPTTVANTLGYSDPRRLREALKRHCGILLESKRRSSTLQSSRHLDATGHQLRRGRVPFGPR